MQPLHSKAVEQTTLSSPLRMMKHLHSKKGQDLCKARTLPASLWMMRQWLVGLAALCLAACAQFPATTGGPQPTMQPAMQPTEPPIVLGPPLDEFVATGRMALRQEKRSDHLRFRWQHTAVGDTVLFMSPLGSGVAEITRDADSVRLTRPNQPPVVADSLPELAQRVFGSPLPLDALADWLRGARPELDGVVDGWRIEISDTSLLPAREAASQASKAHQHRPKADSRLLRVATVSRGDVELKLIVDDWGAGPEADSNSE
jgi:outer membrane lipoprotein LolB